MCKGKSSDNPENLKQNLSANLKAIRLAQKKSMVDFAEQLGIARSTLQDIENGQCNTRLDTIEVISQSLKLDPSFLLSPSETPGQFTMSYALFQELTAFIRLSKSEQQELLRCFKRIVELLTFD